MRKASRAQAKKDQDAHEPKRGEEFKMVVALTIGKRRGRRMIGTPPPTAVRPW